MQSEGLRPGDRLGREQDLAERFGVSRPTLREALQALAAAHLIKASMGPGGGIFVAATPEEGIGHSVSAAVASMLKADSLSIEELLETRLLVVVPLAGLAAQRATDDDIASLEDAIEASSVALDGGGDIQEMDAAVHRMVAEIAGNRLAAAFTTWIVDVLQPSIHALVAQALVEQVVIEQHRDLLRAIARGEPNSAERAMREHLTYVADVIDAVRRSEDDPAAARNLPPG
jgi:GntR family transcriptional regulator, transcriptional repressor for pyruvate dehydrogenase complex